MKRETSLRSQTGQALILLAMAFIGLAAFAGLTIDAGILFSHIGHLRRAVDAASLAAAGQFREGRTAKELSDMALQVIELNGLDATSAIAMVCDREDPESEYNDSSLCPGGENPPPAGHCAGGTTVVVVVVTELSFTFTLLNDNVVPKGMGLPDRSKTRIGNVALQSCPMLRVCPGVSVCAVLPESTITMLRLTWAWPQTPSQVPGLEAALSSLPFAGGEGQALILLALN